MGKDNNNGRGNIGWVFLSILISIAAIAVFGLVLLYMVQVVNDLVSAEKMGFAIAFGAFLLVTFVMFFIGVVSSIPIIYKQFTRKGKK